MSVLAFRLLSWLPWCEAFACIWIHILNLFFLRFNWEPRTVHSCGQKFSWKPVSSLQRRVIGINGTCWPYLSEEELSVWLAILFQHVHRRGWCLFLHRLESNRWRVRSKSPVVFTWIRCLLRQRHSDTNVFVNQRFSALLLWAYPFELHCKLGRPEDEHHRVYPNQIRTRPAEWPKDEVPERTHGRRLTVHFVDRIEYDAGRQQESLAKAENKDHEPTFSRVRQITATYQS